MCRRLRRCDLSFSGSNEPLNPFTRVTIATVCGSLRNSLNTLELDLYHAASGTSHSKILGTSARPSTDFLRREPAATASFVQSHRF